LAYFIGVAKLPFRIPATNAKPTAKGTFDIDESSSLKYRDLSRNWKPEVRSQKSEEKPQPNASLMPRPVGATLQKQSTVGNGEKEESNSEFNIHNSELPQPLTPET
jgi:hypothetical protein